MQENIKEIFIIKKISQIKYFISTFIFVACIHLSLLLIKYIDTLSLAKYIKFVFWENSLSRWVAVVVEGSCHTLENPPFCYMRDIIKCWFSNAVSMEHSHNILQILRSALFSISPNFSLSTALSKQIK